MLHALWNVASAPLGLSASVPVPMPAALRTAL